MRQTLLFKYDSGNKISIKHLSGKDVQGHDLGRHIWIHKHIGLPSTWEHGLASTYSLAEHLDAQDCKTRM